MCQQQQALWVHTHRSGAEIRANTGVSTAEAGLRATPTTVYFVSLHSGWQATSQSTCLGSQLLGRNTQQHLSQPEHSTPAYLTSQLRTGSGGFSSNNWGVDPAHDRAVTTTEQRECPTQHKIQCRLCLPQHKSHHYEGDNSQHTLRKDVADIHTKNSPHTKNIGLTQATQGHSHIKIALQDHSR